MAVRRANYELPINHRKLTFVKKTLHFVRTGVQKSKHQRDLNSFR